ncbi:MAG: tRNA (adenosine(37)-N6)-threonylcarbamoyltransferase complex ATPase subunit type 1 TsaE [Candidatus Omnitrophica bacterium]|nr:tRNA (adenosine(37)-N6)-threonylcarbamoyltransferase complex ATPase subunit type 1 TsaE [Candidatus Omnitrophota bacterium]
MKIITTTSPRKTFDFGVFIAHQLNKGDIICLFGQLGSGKTVLIKGIASGLEIAKDIVSSPSFVLLKQYKGSMVLNHFDLFRLKKIEEILDLGFEEYVYSNDISVIEWAERLGDCLPQDFLGIKLTILGANKRRLSLFANGAHYKSLLKNLK